MTLSRQVLFWGIAFVVTVLALWLVRDILLPFVAGIALAYFLDPLATRLEKLGINRLLASIFILAVFVLLFLLLVITIVPVISTQLGAFVDRLPAYVTRLRSLIADPSRPWLARVVGEGFADPEAAIGELVKQGAGWVAAFLRSLWSGGQALISLFSLLVVTPVVAFYLLYDWHRMTTAVDSWVPLPYRQTVRELAREMNNAIAGFVRGQTGVCLILGSFYAFALTVVGLNFGFLIGLIAGLITFVPYVGSLTGLVLAGGVAVAQFYPDWTSILMVLGIFFFGQFVEGNFLAPKLVGESVGLHPVWLIFSLFAFGYLFGFVGLLLAIPLAASIGVLARFALRQYLASAFYTGAGGSGGARR